MARLPDEPDEPPTRPLARRYAYLKRVRGTHRTIIWLARDLATDERVVVSIVPGPRAAALEPAIDVAAPHLAPLVAVLDSPDGRELPGDEPLAPDCRVAVAEYVEGRSLEERLNAGPVPARLAVEWTVTIAEALAVLHERAAAHGGVSPKVVLVSRADRGEIPVLSQLTAAPAGAYCSPERVTGGGPSEADDTWALAAVLYTAIARRAPFQGATRTSLARAIVLEAPPPIDGIDGDLSALLTRALSKDLRRRFRSGRALAAALREWLETASDDEMDLFAPVATVVGPPMPSYAIGDASVVAAFAHPEAADAAVEMTPRQPTELRDPDVVARAHSSAPPAALTRDTGPSRRAPARPRHPLAFWSTVALAACVSAALGVVAGRLRQRPDVKVIAEAEAPIAGAPSAPPSAVLSTPKAPPAPRKPTSACVSDAFAAGTFKASPSVDFLCSNDDLWSVARKMNVFVTHQARGDGLLSWERLGRFDLAASAVLRDRCCPGAPAFRVATVKGVCESLPESTESVGRDPTPEHADAYSKSVDCLLAHRVRYPTESWDRVGPKDARAAFEAFLSIGSTGPAPAE